MSSVEYSLDAQIPKRELVAAPVQFRESGSCNQDALRLQREKLLARTILIVLYGPLDIVRHASQTGIARICLKVEHIDDVSHVACRHETDDACYIANLLLIRLLEPDDDCICCHSVPQT